MSYQVPYDHHGISGGIHVKLKDGLTLDDICLQHIDDYNPDRFEAVAMRLFAGKEVIATMYVLDKQKQDNNITDPGSLPVKKIKIEGVNVSMFFDQFEEFNFTLSSGNYDLEDIKVVNK